MRRERPKKHPSYATLVKPRIQHIYLLVHIQAGMQTPEMLLYIDSCFLEPLKPFTSPGYPRVEVFTSVFIPTPEMPVHQHHARQSRRMELFASKQPNELRTRKKHEILQNKDYKLIHVFFVEFSLAIRSLYAMIQAAFNYYSCL